MTSLTIELLEIPTIQQVTITDDTLAADLSDGRTIFVPLAWYPRLLHGSLEERNDWRFVGNGNGIHWNQLDEDVSVKNLILGQPSAESQKSFQRWLNSRVAKKSPMDRMPVSSSNLASVGYEPTTQTLEIEFLNGNIYQYSDVPPLVYSGLMAASSHGSYLDQYIKKAGYSYRKVG